MFDGGAPEQLNQLISSSRTSLPIPLSFPLHYHPQSFPSFDPFPSHHHAPLHLQPQLLQNQLPHHLPPPSPAAAPNKEEEEAKQLQINNNLLISPSLELEREISMMPHPPLDPWSDDEVLALLRIRSSPDNWFPDFTWEHVSRKLSELGFKRSADKCKEKFEEESRRHLNTNNYTKNCRYLSELEQICHGDNQNPPQILAQKDDHHHHRQRHHLLPQNNVDRLPAEQGEKMVELSLEEDSRNDQTVVPAGNSSPIIDQENSEKKPKENKKRKRYSKFEIFKVFCQEFVNKMMAQQEELHNKLIEDMVRRDEEKIAMEEAWKKQEIDKINREIEIRAHEQAIAGDRQTKLIEFLKKLTTSSSSNSSHQKQYSSGSTTNAPSLSSTSTSFNVQNQTSSQTLLVEADSLSTMSKNPNSSPSSSALLNPILDQAANSQNPCNTGQKTAILLPSPASDKAHQNLSLGQIEREDIGKRWPRDEVLALIKLRCSVTSSGPDQERDGGNKGPLWERISQGMLELGYKRNAKRCKEKWENINKYFRKIKDANKKRPIDSRTCPYFHQLSSLYSQKALDPPADAPENHLPPPEEGERSLVQAPTSELEF